MSLMMAIQVQKNQPYFFVFLTLVVQFTNDGQPYYLIILKNIPIATNV
jgi:hypothetical protein